MTGFCLFLIEFVIVLHSMLPTTSPLADFATAGLTFNDLKIPFALWNPKDSDGNFVTGNVLIDNIYFEHAD